MAEVAVMGFGNIGSGVVEVIEKNQEQIRRSLPEGLHVKYILDIREFPGSPYADRVVHDIETIINDPEISVVCETMGGKEPALTFSMKALEKGISVCSSNKELVEAFGPKLIAAAREHHCSYLFEASVGGGIPLLSPVIGCLEQEDITSVLGILNGTTNYILTKMETEGAEYEAVLAEAQELGYAEKNPTADVEGHDTGRKIAILSSLMTGKTVRYEDTLVEGITGISQEDIVCAKAHRYRIKLLGSSRKEEGGLFVMTAPFLVPAEHMLSSVHGVFNGVLIHGNMADDLMFYGRGAGKLPTGSAVVSDMLKAARHKGSTVQVCWDEEILRPSSMEGHIGRFMVRVRAEDRASAERAFDGKIFQIWEDGASVDAFVFVTEQMTEKEFALRAEKTAVAGRIRML